MIHYSEVLQRTICEVQNFVNNNEDVTVYVVQNVYGKIVVYVDTDRRELVENLEKKLTKEISEWLSSCEMYKENFFAQVEIEKWKKSGKPHGDRLWVFEKYLTNAYWDGRKRSRVKRSLQSKLISFYSFKGGVGRTTTMILTAIGMAKRGKKIVVLDFDLEAPGVASLFPRETTSQYGLLDFLLESNVYETEINIDEYLYPVGEYCHVNQAGGEIYIMPAVGMVAQNNIETYRKNLMRFDLDIPIYQEEKTPIDVLLTKIDSFIQPDYIFIDTRSGIHQIGGITLSKYSDLAMVFFYGSRQNVEGMRMTLPILKKCDTPFLLLNTKVPVNEELARMEQKVYLEGAYSALGVCDVRYGNNEVLLEDETAEHYPINIPYNAGLEVIDNVDQLVKSYEEQWMEYSGICNVIEDTLQEHNTHGETSEEEAGLQRQIVEAFSDVMNGLETAAAEDEFSTEQDLKNNFYPLKGYTFIFDPRKFLVLGQKGVGKTALFNALRNNSYAKALAKYLNVNTAQYEHTVWIVGTSQATNYIDIFGCLHSEEQVRAFLYYETLNSLLKNDSSLKSLLEKSPVKCMFEKTFTAQQCEYLTGETAYSLNELLVEINNEYQKRNVVVTIIYDSLDRIVSLKNRSKFVSALINMWYMNESKIQNIRSKIFLRKDIYDREVEVSDKVKLKNYSVTIAWEYDQLFAMIWKRAISKSETMKQIYEKIIAQKIEDVPELGYIPGVNEEENRKILSEIVGTKMGSGNKASTYNWFKNRLADTQGIIVPRSMIDIFAKAANKELELRKAGNIPISKSVIRPRCFEEMLPEVSEKRVIDLKEEFKEYAVFLDNLKDTVQRSPVEERTLMDALERAGFEKTREEISNLINIGIIKQYQRKMTDPVRYHFPDIYLRGLGLQRSGMK